MAVLSYLVKCAWPSDGVGEKCQLQLPILVPEKRLPHQTLCPIMTSVNPFCLDFHPSWHLFLFLNDWIFKTHFCFDILPIPVGPLVISRLKRFVLNVCLWKTCFQDEPLCSDWSERFTVRQLLVLCSRHAKLGAWQALWKCVSWGFFIVKEYENLVLQEITLLCSVSFVLCRALTCRENKITDNKR